MNASVRERASREEGERGPGLDMVVVVRGGGGGFVLLLGV